MSQNFKVIFFLKKGKQYDNSKLPIYVRISVDGKRAEWIVQRSIEPGIKWNQKTGRASGTKEDVKVLNAFLDAINSNIFAIQKESAIRNEPMAAVQVRAKILHKKEKNRHTLLQVYNFHNEQFGKLVGLEYSVVLSLLLFTTPTQN